MNKKILALFVFVFILIWWFFLLNKKTKVSKTPNNNILTWKKQIFTKKQIQKSKIFVKKITNYTPIVETFINWFCSWKKTLEEVTCSTRYYANEPKLYWLLQWLYKSKKFTYDELVAYLYTELKKKCKLSQPDLEVLLDATKSNYNGCMKKWIVLKKLKNNIKKAFSNIKISKKNIDKPFNIYYTSAWADSLADIEQRKAQILIIENINKDLSWQNISPKQFRKILLDSVEVDTVESLKQKILKQYEYLFDTYNFKQCWLTINWYGNYFDWENVLPKALKCFKQKIIMKKNYKKDYSKFMKLISIYTYETKDFLWAKFRAEKIFWREWVWIINVLDLNIWLKWN